MGNCLAVEKQVVKVMTMEGKALEFRSPVRVYEVLSEFRDHAVSDALPVSTYMQASAELVSGSLYHLVPLQKQLPKPGKKKKKVRFSIPEEGGEESPSLRVKLVISKQKLREMIETGVLPVGGGMGPSMQKNEIGESCFDDGQRDTVEKPAFI